VDVTVDIVWAEAEHRIDLAERFDFVGADLTVGPRHANDEVRDGRALPLIERIQALA
jgi:hypothetical protein